MSSNEFNVDKKEFRMSILFKRGNIVFKANKKYIGIYNNLFRNNINIYSLDKNIKDDYFVLEIEFTLFELNQKYQNVLLISRDCFAELYELPNEFNKSKIKLNPKIKYKIDEYINQISFNPRYSHIIALLTKNKLHIWDNRKFYNPIQQPFESNFESFIWETKGNLCGLSTGTEINIFNRKKKYICFNYNISDFSDYIYEFLDEKRIIIIIDSKLIKIISIIGNEEIKKHIEFDVYDIIKTTDYIIFKSENDLYFYYYNNLELEYFDKINSLVIQNPIILEDSNVIKFLSSGKSSFELITISSKDESVEKIKNQINIKMVNEENKSDENIIHNENEDNDKNEDEDEDKSIFFYDEEDILTEDYFKGCIFDQTNIIGLLKYDNDEKIILPDKINKKYFEIKKIKESFEKQSKNLINLKNYVKEEIQKERDFNDNDEEYLFYTKLLIKDNTNKNLLKKYLKFLKHIEKNKIILNNPHENFKDELNYYLPLFDENDLKEFHYTNFTSEKEKVEEILNNIRNSINNNSFKELKDSIKNIYFIYNHPFPLDSSEIIFLRCKISLLEDIKYFKYTKFNEKERFEYLKHIIDTILKNNILEKIDSPHKLIALLDFIREDEDKETYDFFFNLINSEIYDDKNKEKNSSLSFECKENIILNEKLSEKYDKEELYCYEYLIKHPPLRINIAHIKEFLKIVLSSNVFKDLFKFLTGRDDYEEIFNLDMITYIINNIQFIPLNFKNTSAFTDKLTLCTYISTMKKTIFYNLGKADNKIFETLENGIIIEIEFHEFGHIISAVLSYINNIGSLVNTPRKKNFKINEGGYYIEMALFGKIIKTLKYKEALYILNINNYSKFLDEFRNGFESLKKDDLEIKGPFKFLNLNKLESTEIMESSISGRGSNKDYEEAKISIPFKNDIKGRDFNIDDLLKYT